MKVNDECQAFRNYRQNFKSIHVADYQFNSIKYPLTRHFVSLLC